MLEAESQIEAGDTARPRSLFITWRELMRLWRDSTLNKVVVVLVLVSPILVLKTLVVPTVASFGVSGWAEGIGVDLEVGDWDATLLNLSAIARDSAISSRGRWAESEVLQARAVDIDLSLWRWLRGNGFGQRVHLEQPRLYVERSPSGGWNWQSAIRLPSEVRQDIALALAGASPEKAGEGFSVRELSVDGMVLDWVEEVPSDRKEGLRQVTTATLRLDDISGTVEDVRGWIDPRTLPSTLSLAAATGEGKISLDARVNLLNWALDAQKETADSDGAFRWSPRLDGKISLQSIGAGAFARLLPTSPLTPTQGYLSGRIELRVDDDEIECVATLTLEDVAFEANPSSPVLVPGYDDLDADLRDYRANGQRTFVCGGPRGSAEYRPVQAFLTQVIRKGVDQAPRRVRAVAEVEHQRYSTEPVDPELVRDVNRILGRLDPAVREWLALGAALGGMRPPGGRPGGVLDSVRRGLPFGRRP